MRGIALLAATSTCALVLGCTETPAREQSGASLHVAANTLMGVHFAGSPDDPDLDRMMDGQRGFTVELVYADQFADWQAELMRRLSQRGLTVILRIDASQGQNAPTPGHEGDLASFVVDRLIPSLGDAVSIFVLGNEPNLTVECRQVGGDCDPGQYAASYRRLRDAMHTAYPDRDLTLLVAGMSPGDVVGERVVAGNEYYRQVLSALGPGEVDGIALHAYGGGDEEASVAGFVGSVDSQLGTFAETGHGGVPVFITEMNRVSDGELDEVVSARFLRRAYAWVDEHNRGGGQGIVGACWFIYEASEMWGVYSLRSLKSGDDEEDWRADSDVWHAFRAAARARYAPGPFAGVVFEPPPGPETDPPGEDPADGASGDCACHPDTDNICLYGPRAAGCDATWPGGYCDPNGDGDFSDADWDRGWYEHHDLCAAAPPAEEPTCECRGDADNICLYGVRASGCEPTWPGGYCDPNGDGDFSDADWDRGWYEHHDRCG